MLAQGSLNVLYTDLYSTIHLKGAIVDSYIAVFVCLYSI